MSLTDTIRILSEQVAATPTDTAARLALADAIQETGDEATAAQVRREAAASALRDKIIAAGFDADRVYTRGVARDAKGHEARTAERILAAASTLLVVVFGDDAVTKTGLTRGPKDSPILYYRKSSGGRWGRSVQKFRVAI